jgi:hypothetical protein
MRGFGNIISVRKGVDGITDTLFASGSSTDSAAGYAMPVVLGAAAVVGTAMLIKKMIPAGSAGMSATLHDKAPLVGALAGSLAGLGLVFGMKKRAAGTTMIATSALLGGVLQYQSSLGLAGFGAIVPEYGMGAVMPMMNGLGATVLEEWNPGQRPDSIGALSGAYGTTVDLSGLGAVNTGAFGTPGFHV